MKRGLVILSASALVSASAIAHSEYFPRDGHVRVWVKEAESTFVEGFRGGDSFCVLDFDGKGKLKFTPEYIKKACHLAPEITKVDIKAFVTHRYDGKQHRVVFEKTKIDDIGWEMEFQDTRLYPYDKKVAWCKDVDLNRLSKVLIKRSKRYPKKGLDCYCLSKRGCKDSFRRGKLINMKRNGVHAYKYRASHGHSNS